MGGNSYSLVSIDTWHNTGRPVYSTYAQKASACICHTTVRSHICLAHASDWVSKVRGWPLQERWHKTVCWSASIPSLVQRYPVVNVQYTLDEQQPLVKGIIEEPARERWEWVAGGVVSEVSIILWRQLEAARIGEQAEERKLGARSLRYFAFRVLPSAMRALAFVPGLPEPYYANND